MALLWQKGVQKALITCPNVFGVSQANSQLKMKKGNTRFSTRARRTIALAARALRNH